MRSFPQGVSGGHSSPTSRAAPCPPSAIVPGMPIRRCQRNGSPGFAFGPAGHCYPGPNGYAQALQQARAVKAAQVRRRVAAAVRVAEEALGDAPRSALGGYGSRGPRPGGSFRRSTRVQTLLLPIDGFTAAEARDWARAHKFAAPYPDLGLGPRKPKGDRSRPYEKKADYWRLRQFDPKDAEPGTLRTIVLSAAKGIKAVIAVPKEGSPAASTATTSFGAAFPEGALAWEPTDCYLASPLPAEAESLRRYCGSIGYPVGFGEQSATLFPW